MSNSLQDLIDSVRAEYDRTQRELREIKSMSDQSKAEVDRVTQRNASITNQMRQINQNFDTVPRADLKAAYEAQLKGQQQLFTMRGQLEKFQSDQAHLEQNGAFLKGLLEVLGEVEPDMELPKGGAKDGGAAGSAGAGADPVVVRIINAQESERQRLSKTLHDGPAQSLTNFILQAEIVQRLFDSNPEQARIELQNLKTTAGTTFQRVRDFIAELRPMMLDDLGLVPTVRRYVKGFEEKTGVPTALTVTGNETRFEPHCEVLAFRGIQELLINARDHAEASQIKVTLDVSDNFVRGSVEDNGKGFNVAEATDPVQKHIGLTTLREKTELLGGQLEIESAIGQGTRAIFEIPISGSRDS